MNYWFLYNLIDGTIYGSPYLGLADEWTNIPNGCGAIGPFEKEVATNEVKQAYLSPLSYKIVGGNFIYVQYIPPVQPPQPKTELEILQERVSANKGALDFLIMNSF